MSDLLEDIIEVESVGPKEERKREGGFKQEEVEEYGESSRHKFQREHFQAMRDRVHKESG